MNLLTKFLVGGAAAVIVGSVIGNSPHKSRVAGAFPAATNDREEQPSVNASQQLSPSAPVSDQDGVVAKMKDAQAQSTAGNGYTRGEYATTYRELGKVSFAKLNILEPGALYAVAESKQCDRVTEAGLSEKASPKNLSWYVDCGNGNRFIVDQDEAQNALDRFRSKRLAFTDFAASCTASTLSMCDATPEQKAANEATIVASCDAVLDEALISAGGASKAWTWSYGFGPHNTLIVDRDFSSKNAFGAKLKSHYHCVVDAAKNKITKMVVSGPFGDRRIV